MMLAEKMNIVVNTNVSFFTAVFERAYMMEIHKESGDNALVSLTCVDMVPSGYANGGSRRTLIELEELEIPKSGLAKQWMASLALKYDTSLAVRNGCEEHNKSMRVLSEKLGEMML